MSSKRKSPKGKPGSKGGAGGGAKTASGGQKSHGEGRKTAARMGLKSGSAPLTAQPSAPVPPKTEPPKPEAPTPKAPKAETPKPETPTPVTGEGKQLRTAGGQDQYRRPAPLADEGAGASPTGRPGGLTWPIALVLILMGAGALFVYAQVHTSPCARTETGAPTEGQAVGARECAQSWFSWSHDRSRDRGRDQNASQP